MSASALSPYFSSLHSALTISASAGLGKLSKDRIAELAMVLSIGGSCQEESLLEMLVVIAHRRVCRQLHGSAGSAVVPFSKLAVRLLCFLDDLLCFLPRQAVLCLQLQLLEFAVLLFGIQSFESFSLRGS